MPPTKEKNMHAEHRLRLKKRFRKEGLDHFEPHNAMELLLFFGIPVKDVNALAHTLVSHFGSFSAALDSDYEELLRIKGVGEHVATLLKLVPAVARYYMTDSENQPVVFKTIEQMADFIRPRFIARTKEVVYLLALGNKGQALFSDVVFEGGVNSVAIYIRDIIEIVVRTKATSVVLAHNHPGGIAVPSNKDLVATHSARESLEAMEVRLLDHLVFAGSDYVSMRESHYF